jgi:predicted nucleic acid-binding protein
MLIYRDSVVTIYLIEQVQPFLPRVESHTNAPGASLAVSDLTRLECRVHPLMNNDPARLAQFDAFFATVRVVPLTTGVFDRATTTRAAHRFRTVDSIHLAAAVEAGCNVFLTNDQQLKQFTGITVEVI